MFRPSWSASLRPISCFAQQHLPPERLVFSSSGRPRESGELETPKSTDRRSSTLVSSASPSCTRPIPRSSISESQWSVLTPCGSIPRSSVRVILVSSSLMSYPIKFTKPTELRLALTRLLGKGVITAEGPHPSPAISSFLQSSILIWIFFGSKRTGEVHKRQRKTLAPAFSTASLKPLLPILCVFSPVLSADDPPTNGLTLPSSLNLLRQSLEG